MLYILNISFGDSRLVILGFSLIKELHSTYLSGDITTTWAKVSSKVWMGLFRFMKWVVNSCLIILVFCEGFNINLSILAEELLMCLWFRAYSGQELNFSQYLATNCRYTLSWFWIAHLLSAFPCQIRLFYASNFVFIEEFGWIGRCSSCGVSALPCWIYPRLRWDIYGMQWWYPLVQKGRLFLVNSLPAFYSGWYCYINFRYIPFVLYLFLQWPAFVGYSRQNHEKRSFLVALPDKMGICDAYLWILKCSSCKISAHTWWYSNLRSYWSKSSNWIPLLEYRLIF